jgi:hypothetical protein
MKLEHFDDADDGRGVLLLYGDTPRQVARLSSELGKLAKSGGSVPIHELEFVESVGSCHLTAVSAPKARGVTYSAPEQGFRWIQTPYDWETTVAFLEPFTNASAAEVGVCFQYLNPNAGPEVIYSTSRRW